MILADTSVWVDHLRASNPAFEALLQNQIVLIHPFVIGELAVGNLPARSRTLRSFQRMSSANMATDAEVLGLIERENLFGTGIGYVDSHLLASARLTAGTKFWTRDKRLKEIAGRLGVAADFS